jgi:hypothetical protein
LLIPWWSSWITTSNGKHITAENIIRLTNQERAAAGLNTLNTNAKLTAAAQAKANNMFEVHIGITMDPMEKLLGCL